MTWGREASSFRVHSERCPLLSILWLALGPVAHSPSGSHASCDLWPSCVKDQDCAPQLALVHPDSEPRIRESVRRSRGPAASSPTQVPKPHLVARPPPPAIMRHFPTVSSFHSYDSPEVVSSPSPAARTCTAKPPGPGDGALRKVCVIGFDGVMLEHGLFQKTERVQFPPPVLSQDRRGCLPVPG